MSAAPRPSAGLPFGHPLGIVRFWKRLVREALRFSGSSPLYLCSAQPVADRIAELDLALGDPQLALPPSRHWLSCKTQPLRPLLRWWQKRAGHIEVVSEFELRAGLTEGFAPERILVNGPAKHHWLPRLPLRGLSVNFDSAAEMKALLPLAKRLNWRVGVRVCTSEEFNPENPKLPAQFGFMPDDAVLALRRLQRAGVQPEILHFHLRTNVASAQVYERAIREVAQVSRAAGVRPAYLDVGGGLPPPHTRSRAGEAFDAGWSSTARGSASARSRSAKGRITLKPAGPEAGAPARQLAEALARSVKWFPGLREIWLENGRFVSAGSGVLVVKVLDVKERRGVRQLICDGGRTLNALVSNWEQHALLALPERHGPAVLTAVYGPTCMAFDQLALGPMPRSIRAGDHLIWMEAGAYHIPWETRFSHGHAAVVWHDERGLRLCRERQDFEEWWASWT